MFQQVNKNRIFEDIIEQIQEAILNGSLKTGDRLPSERELKDMFKTSRGTLREALRALEQKGLIKIKTGMKGGAVIKEITTRQVSESLDLLIRSQQVSLEHLAQFRQGVEGIVTELAAHDAETSDITSLKEIITRAGECTKEGIHRWDDFINLDNEFHMSLAYTAKNPIYISVLKTVHDHINRYYNRFLPKEQQFLDVNFRDLCDIADAVGRHEPDIAKAKAIEHVSRFYTYMEETRDAQIYRQRS